MRRYGLLYLLVITIPLFLGLVAWQSFRYRELDRRVRRLEVVQEDWIVSNKKLIAGIAVLSSSERIEQVAMNDLRLTRIHPENVLQVWIQGGWED